MTANEILEKKEVLTKQDIMVLCEVEQTTAYKIMRAVRSVSDRLGIKGIIHSKEFRVVDPYITCVEGAKFELGLIIKLLSNNGEKAKQIISEYKPVFSSVEEYLEYKRSFNMSKQAVKYNEDGSITLNYKG